jgi:hypothetical protein
MDDLKEERKYWNLEEEALAHSVETSLRIFLKSDCGINELLFIYITFTVFMGSVVLKRSCCN